MSGLTAEQRQRMEENRKKALQKLSGQKASYGSNTSSGGSFGAAPSANANSFSQNFNKYQSSGAGTFSKSPAKTFYGAGSSNVSSSSDGAQTYSSGGISQPVSSVGDKVTTSNSSSRTFIGLEEAKKIAENRRKALEKRAAQQASSSSSKTVGSDNISSSDKQLTGKPVTDFYKSSVSKQTDKYSSNQYPQFNKSNQSNSFSKSSSSDFRATSYNSSFKTNQGFSSSKYPGGQQSKEDKINAMLNEPDAGVKPVHGKTLTGTFRLMSRERFVVDVGYHKQMIEIFKTMASRKYDVETRKWNFCLTEHDLLIEALKPLRPSVCISPLPHFVRKTLQTVAKQMPASCVDLFGLDPKLLEALLPFQHDGVCFGVNLAGRVMFADDMGLGKTIQALGVASYYRREWPLLIVTPSSVRYSWVTAIERWVTTIERQDITVLNSGKDYIDNAQVVITSYDLLSRRAKELLDYNFQIVIMDESHMLKSFKTARYKAAAPIMKRARRVILLSGTPALSRPSELYTQISGIDPNLFPGFHDYGVRYCGGKQQQWGWDFSGSSNMEELQIILEAKLMIRRLKSEVLDQLPSKQRMMVMLDPGMIKSNTKAMTAAAQQLGLKSLRGAEKHGALLQFFAESAVAKQKAVGEYIKELLEGESKFIVFAHHRVMLDKICDTCENVKAKYIRIDGRTSGDVRQHLVDKFQNNSEVRVAVLSITAANAGITLTAAQLVVFAEVFWNPGILVQAEDRAHRIGQQDCVTVQYLIGQGTVDDHIWPLVQSKLEVLSKAGLSKETNLGGNATYQKEGEKESIKDYLVELQNMEEFSEDMTGLDEASSHSKDKAGTVEIPSPVKRKKQGGIQQYLSQEGNNNANDDEPQSKKVKS